MSAATAWIVVLFFVARFHDPSITMNETCKAAAVFGEARGESTRGQRLVAQVIAARVASSRWPGSACAVVLEPHQFDAIAALTARTLPTRINRAAWRKALRVARHTQPDPHCPGITHFATRGAHAPWRHAMRIVCSVGHQDYMRTQP